MQAYKKDIGLFLLCIVIFLAIGYHCPFQSVLGIPCPGCNFTTSLYYLIKGDIQTSIYYHALCIPSLCFFLLFIFYFKKKKVLYSLVWIWAGTMIVYYIYRMIVIFPSSPMIFDGNSIIGFISRWIG